MSCKKFLDRIFKHLTNC